MPAGALHHANARENTKNIMEIDSDALTRDITSFSSEMARYQASMDVHLPLLDSLNEITRLCLIATFEDGDLDRDSIEREVRAKLAYLRTFFSGIRGKVVYHIQRAQAQRETAVFLIPVFSTENKLTLIRSGALLHKKITCSISGSPSPLNEIVLQ
jgi:hypothetical protein